MASELNEVWPEEAVEETEFPANVNNVSARATAVTATTPSSSPPHDAFSATTTDLQAIILEELMHLRREHNQKSAIQIVVTMVCFAIVLSYLETMKRKSSSF